MLLGRVTLYGRVHLIYILHDIGLSMFNQNDASSVTRLGNFFKSSWKQIFKQKYPKYVVTF